MRSRALCRASSRTIVETVPFASLLLGDHASSRTRRPMHRNVQQLVAQANATFTNARTTTAEIRHNLAALRNELSTLARLRKALAQHQSE